MMDNLRPDGRIPRSDYDGHVWYSDGDICAYVLDNLALDISGADMARLFAAAPDLLRALMMLMHGDGCFCEASFAGPGTIVSHTPECKAAMLAIARARGEG